MRTIALVITAGLAMGFAVPAIAAQTPTFAACETLSEQRGGDVGASNHRHFMADCLAGKIAFAAGVASPTPRQTLRAQSFDKCEALAEQRGSTVGRDHRKFVTDCMAGKIT